MAGGFCALPDSDATESRTKVRHVDFEHLQELIRIFEGTQLSELEIEEEGRRVCMKKGLPAIYSQTMLPAAGVPQAMYVSPNGTVAFANGQGMPADTAEPAKDKPVTIDAPMVGTFYASPAPGEPPFVSEGDMVEPNQTVCIVEAMKLMNEVTAKYACVIEKILVGNGEPVEFGQPLFIVRPSDPAACPCFDGY